NFATLQFGRSDNGSTDTNCSSTNTVSATGWTRYTCTFTTGTTSSPYVFIRQTDSTPRTIYIDAVQLEILSQVVTNSGFETDTSGWTHKGATDTITRDTSVFVAGVASLRVDTAVGDAAGTDGAKTTAYTLAPNTTYTLSQRVYTTPAFSKFEMGYATNGVDIPCITNYTITNATWNLLSCTFRTGSGVTDSYIYAKQTDAATRTFYLDEVTLLPSTSAPFTLGKVSLNGIVNSPVTLQASSNSATALQVQNASGGSLFNIDSNTATITINGTNNPDTQPWTATPSTPTNRVYHTVVSGGGYIYSLGGSTTASGADKKVYYAQMMPNGALGSFATNTLDLPVNRSHHASVMANGYVYVMGGYDGSSVQSTVYYGRANPDGSISSWNTTTALPSNVEDATALVNNGYVYVIG
ncbi:MAG: hypothetical protein AAB914_02695, partial [Patescibacteria group bacterium]